MNHADGQEKIGTPAVILMASVFVVAACGLTYELLAGTLSTYLLGNSVTQFSLVIGLFLSAMGVGSFLSKYIRRNLLGTFLLVEIAVGAIGGVSALMLFFTFALLDTYLPILIGISVSIGALVGLEVPLLVRIIRTHTDLRSAIGNVLALDYLGALAASLLFPLILLPWLGLVRTGFLFGLLNVVVAAMGLVLFGHKIARAKTIKILTTITAVGLLVGMITAGTATTWIEDNLYDDDIIFAKTTPYQRLVLTRWKNDIRLFIDGNLQFSSADEFRYHESLVHPAMSMVPGRRRVLLLGAGDGMAAREVLKYDSVECIDLVDLDPEMTRLFSTQPMLVKLNKASLLSSKVKIHNNDAQKFLERSNDRWDVIIMDLPDPNNEALGKLYTKTFFRLAVKHLYPTGILVTQSTSPFYATDAFWCIANTLSVATDSDIGSALHILAYHANIPSFGDWGFVMASAKPISPSMVKLKVPTRFLTSELVPTLFVFSKDIGPRKTPINLLDNQILVSLYDKGYSRYNQ